MTEVIKVANPKAATDHRVKVVQRELFLEIESQEYEGPKRHDEEVGRFGGFFVGMDCLARDSFKGFNVMF